MMGCAVAEAQRRVDSAEFVEWKYEDQRSPLDVTLRMERAMGTLAYVMAASHGAKGVTHDSFRIDWEKALRRRSGAEIEAEMMAWAHRHNRQQERKRKQQGKA